MRAGEIGAPGMWLRNAENLNKAREGHFWSPDAFVKLSADLTRAQRDELRAHQIAAVVELSPIVMAVNAVCILIVDVIFWSPDRQGFLMVWTAAMAVVTAWWTANRLRTRNRPPRRSASLRGVKRMTWHAGLAGLIWAAPMLFLFNGVDEAGRVVLVAAVSGAAATGALMLALIWQAALVYSVAVILPSLIVLSLRAEASYVGLSALSALYGFAIARTVAERCRLFVENFIKATHLREQSQVIGLLLKDFEENSSDWLFEIDADGRLVNVPARQASSMSASMADLCGRDIVANLAQGYARADGSSARPLRGLKRSFRRRAAFRDIVLPLTINGDDRWWSLTARPIYDDGGVFLGYRGVGSDVTETKRAEASIEHLASYDALTGLPNRNLFQSRLKRAMRHLRQGGDVFAVHSIDLDRFKNVNDALGHVTGDALLIEAARRILALMGPNDIAARFGGDEFVILQGKIPGTFAAGELAERLIAALAAPYNINGHRVLVGATVGIAIASDVMSSSEDLLRNSDLALYRAKAAGKGRHCFYADEMDAAVQARRLLEIDLREALENSALEVYFQPLVEIATGRVSACEALVRWKHPTRGYVPPVEFIPLAEETGLIIPLGEFVLRTACREAASWSRDIRVAVNLSAIQFQSGDLVELVGRILREAGLRPDRLELEITESILMENKDAVSETLAALRALGARIALDDFGTGYSSLAYLSSFPFDKIKIDRSFVRDVGNRPEAAAIIQAIATLAATLNMGTTAEGVEFAAELDWLRDNGCDEAQGYLFSPPVPARELRYLIGHKPDNAVAGLRIAG